MSTQKKTADRLAHTYPSEDTTDLDLDEVLRNLAADHEFLPEPPCEHCIAAQVLANNANTLCEVHTRQSLPYNSPLHHHGPDGPEKQRQDAWILY